MHDPIAYIYGADHHCEACAIKANMVDAEETGVVAPWDEWYNIGEGNQTLVCGTCGGVIEEYKENDD